MHPLGDVEDSASTNDGLSRYPTLGHCHSTYIEFREAAPNQELQCLRNPNPTEPQTTGVGITAPSVSHSLTCAELLLCAL
jgi:hypothetical protein